MKFKPTGLEGSYVIELELREDERGYFARTFCKNEFATMGLEIDMVQGNTSSSKYKNTIRGLHFQKQDAAETKLIRCIKGSIMDVIVDIRPDSKTFLKHFKIVLSSENNLLLYVPRGFAHGYITLEDNTEIIYQVSNFYTPAKESGIRWNDPLLNINWNCENPHISEKDNNHPDFAP